MTRREFFALTAMLGLAGLCQAEELNTLIRTDPRCPPEAFADIMEYFRKMRLNQEPISEEKRLKDGRAWLAGAPVEELQEGEESFWLEVPRADGSLLKLRVLRPNSSPQGAVLSFHGGGWVMGTALSDEKRNWLLAREAKVVVLSPDYRLAPEHPFPAGPDDCELAARWLQSHGKQELGTGRFATVGASAGAHLAALTLLRRPETFRCAVLYYGVYDLARSKVWRESSEKDFPDLSPEEMNLFLRWFIPDKDDEARRSALYSPLYAGLKNLPPALFLVGTADLLASDTRRFAEKWAALGNPAELVEYPGAPHGFDGFDIDCGLNPHRYAADFIARHLHP